MDGQTIVEGIGASPGIAVGPVFPYSRGSITVEHRSVEAGEIEGEIARLDEAIRKAERDLKKIAAITREKLGPESAEIFEAHRMMLRDEHVYQSIVDRIRQESCNADYAVNVVMTKHRRLIAASGSEYMRERASDLQDVQERMIRHLRRGKLISSVAPNTIVVSESLTAADVILFSRRGIVGCAMTIGGATSHVAIMARALGLPTVVGVHGIAECVSEGDMVVVDGLSGRVVINPSEQTVDFYRTRQRRYQHLVRQNRYLVPLPAETLDGVRIRLRGNIEFKEEIKLLHENGAEGVGLFRTEIMFLMRGQLDVTEEDQYATFRRLVEAMSPEVTTFRVLDLGGDKLMPTSHREHNPYLGWRGIRILLDKPELIRPQIRAILRAANHGPVRILLPMVTTLSEVRRFRQLIEDVRTKADEPLPDVELGIMVEVPSVALSAAKFAAEVDFFSLGTNDLTQYVLAVDRGNDLVSSLSQELHPAVLGLIKQTIDAAREADIPVALCGEMATNPRAIPVLIGLGLREFSASPIYLPAIKRIIRSIRIPDVEVLAGQVLASATTEEAIVLIDAWLDEHVSGILHLFRTGPLEVPAPGM
jgi:phosphoenolpyruvate-protein phosphotransferase (PTS system enzyme I)